MGQIKLLPSHIKTHDKVAIVAPAGVIDPEKLNIGIKFIESAGLVPFQMPHLLKKSDYLAGTDAERAEDFNQAFSDRKLRAVFCARGGYGSLRILNRINWQSIRDDPKPLIGFSDITGLVMALYLKVGLVSFSGPMLAGTQMEPMTQDQKAHYFELLSNPGYYGKLPGNGKSLQSGFAQGVLLGGNLTMLLHCAAANVLPSLNGAILLIEDVNEAPYRIDRALTTLKISGRLDGIAGILSGEFPGIQPEETDRIILDCLGDLNVPILSRFPIGHGKQNVAVPVGLDVRLDTESGTVHTISPAVI